MVNCFFFCYSKAIKGVDFLSQKMFKIDKYTNSYDNEGFVPDFINYYGFERDEVKDVTISIHQNTQRIKQV